MNPPYKKQIKQYLKIFIALASVGLVILCILLVREYKHIRQLDYISARKSSLFNALHINGPATLNNIKSIQPWMTFDYVNHLFNMPSEYLKSSLFIEDGRYPRITISEYAGDTHVDKATILMQVQGFVQVYLMKK